MLDELTRLESIGVEGVEIGVEDSFNLSYTRLNPETARVFRCLAVFRDTFDAAAEESVCEDAGHKRLSELVRRSLALYEEKTGRYRLHDLARVFAGSRLSDAERDASASRHAEHYQRALAAANALYLKGGDDIARGLALFDRERANIESGQVWAAANIESDESAPILCITYPDAGAEMFHLRRHPRELIRWLEAMLTAARRLNRRDAERRALGNLGTAYHHLGDFSRAIDFYNQSLDIARETGDRGNEGRMLLNMGVAHKDLGEPRDALELYERALAFFREIGDRRNEGTALGHIGVAYEDLSETRRAIKRHKQRLVIAREIGDRLGEATAFANLGGAYSNLNRSRRAIKFYERQLAIVREIGAPREEAHGLRCKAAILYNLGDRQQAIPHLEAALSIYEQIEDPQAETVRTLLSLASRKSHVGPSLKELLRVSWAMFKFLRKMGRKP